MTDTTKPNELEVTMARLHLKEQELVSRALGACDLVHLGWFRRKLWRFKLYRTERRAVKKLARALQEGKIKIAMPAQQSTRVTPTPALRDGEAPLPN